MTCLRHRKLISFAILGVSAFVLAGCSSQQNSSDSAKDKILAVSSKATISTMDSSLNTDQYGAQNLNNTMEGLYRFSGKKLQPGVAKAIAKPTDGGKKYTIELKHTKWSNGDPVTADDFVYAWRRICDPKTGSQYSYIYSGIENADDIVAGKKDPKTLGIKALGKYKLQITLEHPIPYFDTLVSGAQFLPINKKAIDKMGDQYGLTSEGMIFNGPYQLKNWKVGDTEWHEVKNKSYWNAKNVKLNELKYYYVADPNTGLNLYNTKVIDRYADLSGDSARQLSHNKDFKTTPKNGTYFLELNEQKLPYLKNEKLRQALSLTINREELCNIILGKTGTPAHQLTPAKMSQNPKTGTDFTDEPTLVADRKYTDYNPELAKKLWQEGMKETGQKEINLTLTADNTDTTKKLAEYLQSNMEKDLPGFHLTISSVPFKTRLQRQQSKQFDLVTSAWVADYPDPTNFLDLETTGNANNDGSWSNKEYDALVKKAETTDANDPVARWNDLIEAQHILTKEQGIITTYQDNSAALTRPNVKGLNITPTGIYDMGAAYKNNK